MLYERCNRVRFWGYLVSSYPEEETEDVEVVKEDSHSKRKKEDKVVIQKTVCLSHLNCTEKGIFDTTELLGSELPLRHLYYICTFKIPFLRSNPQIILVCGFPSKAALNPANSSACVPGPSSVMWGSWGNVKCRGRGSGQWQSSDIEVFSK